MAPKSFGGCSLVSSTFQPCLLALCHGLQKLHWTKRMNTSDCVWKRDRRFGDAPALKMKKAQGWCPREQRLWGGSPHPAPIWKSPSLHQCPHSHWESPWRLWGLDTPKKPQPLNFWPALIYWFICQVAAFFYFLARTPAIIKIILEALTEHWSKSFPQSLQQNH